jgi:quercetin 2,3-dioxygenase
MTNQVENKLPENKEPYLQRAGEGNRYLLGTQLATVIATTESTGNMFEWVILSGGKGAGFPSHIHERTHKAIYVLHGSLELNINGKSHLLISGNYAQIPAGTVHSYSMLSHRTRFLSITMKGEIAKIYSVLGKPYDKYEHPPNALNEFSIEQLLEAEAVGDIKFVSAEPSKSKPEIVGNNKLPSKVEPYVLETNGGERFVSAEYLFTFLTTQVNTDGEFISVMCEAPKGDRIPEHFHEKHTETFFCLEGQLTMWVNGEEITLYPGDFLHVPENTIHTYRCDSHFTKFFGVLTPGIFEPFFRTLGDPTEDYVFPYEPGPLRFDRVLANLDNLDLKPVGGPPSGVLLPNTEETVK